MRAFWTLIILVSIATTSEARVDSTGVKVIDGKVYILHQVDAGQGLYSISKRYSVAQDLIKKANSQLSQGLKVGQEILIPTDLKPADLAPKEALPPGHDGKGPSNVIYHDVEPGQTLYAISRLSECRLSIEELRKWNNLKDNELALGQRLIIGFRDEDETRSMKEAMEAEKRKNDSTKAVQSSGDNSPVAETWSDKVEKGLATWIPDDQDSPGKSFALFNGASKGTVLRVRNLKNDEVTYVRVIGDIKNQDRKDLIIVLTEAAVKKLGTDEKYFRVELQYSLDED